MNHEPFFPSAGTLAALRRLGMTTFSARSRAAAYGRTVVLRAAAVFVALVMPRPAPDRKAKYLLIDVSNSFTKLALASSIRLGAAERIETERLSLATLGKFVRERGVERLVVSSVVPKKDALIRRAARKVPVTFVSAKCRLGVGVDYPEPASIGADRLANAAAVAALYGCPAVVVDFGTAVTFDVVSAERCYIGGVIAPGLEAMTSYLYKRTALLPKLTLAEPAGAVGRSTKGAMMSGAVFGYRGLVKEILARISVEAFGRRKARSCCHRRLRAVDRRAPARDRRGASGFDPGRSAHHWEFESLGHKA